jgi:uncharacterized protein Yka (UPF0111/DUF47 family)
MPQSTDNPLVALARKVQEMRSTQKSYFALANSGDYLQKKKVLQKSKQLEKEVDALVKQILESSTPQNPQTTLWN